MLSALTLAASVSPSLTYSYMLASVFAFAASVNARVLLAKNVSKFGGAERVRTDDLLNANQPLFQLSYGPSNSPRLFSPAPLASSILNLKDHL